MKEKQATIADTLRRHRLGIRQATDKIAAARPDAQSVRTLRQILSSTEEEINRARRVLSSVQ